MKILQYILFVLLLGICLGCATKLPATTNKTAPNPEVIITEGSDPVPKDQIEYLVKRTEKLCQEGYSTGVRKLVINYNKKTSHTTVGYICKRRMDDES